MTQLVTVVTLVDITNTGVRRAQESNSKEYHQQQNLNVLLQTCGLLTQVFDPQVTILHDSNIQGRMSKFFGVTHATVWLLKFRIETDQVWRSLDNELALLEQDVNGVAITSDLDNVVEFPVNIFDTQDNINTYFIIS